MITIHNLEVRFEVEGDGDEAAFVKLFEKYVRQWNDQQEESRTRERRAARERALGDQQPEELEL
ncbi:MAG TPA: hypothetical protein VJ302_23905 [Blastocatellia bacterium]|nr:hypothetical protein [Blastocatellia bacterium]